MYKVYVNGELESSYIRYDYAVAKAKNLRDEMGSNGAQIEIYHGKTYMESF